MLRSRSGARVGAVLLTVCVLIGSLIVPASGGPVGSGREVFQAEGRITGMNPLPFFTGAPSFTETEFFLTCTIPLTQGVDSWVFEIPEAFRSGTFTLTGEGSPIGHDLDTWFYDAECGFLGSSDQTGEVETGRLPSGTAFLVATPFVGVQTLAKLRIETGEPEPEPTPTPEPTPSPGDGGRATYPIDPNDQFFGQQWGMTKINAPQAWQRRNATGHGITIAIVDSGLDLRTASGGGIHPDFDCSNKVVVLPGSDVTSNDDDPHAAAGGGHGTHVAGIAGACTNNSRGVVGVAPGATIMPVRVDPSIQQLDAVMAEGIEFATANGAHVINLSIGPPVGLSAAATFTYPETEAAMEAAAEAGVIIAAAAGNWTQPYCEYPSMSRNVICVSATDPDDEVSFYSDRPVNVDPRSEDPGFEPGVLAPGGAGIDCAGGIVSTYLRSEQSNCQLPSGYTNLDGTSMASPMVAGLAALLYDRIGGVRNAANAQQIIDTILTTAADLGPEGYDPLYGYGRIDALAAVLAVPVSTTVSFTENTTTTVTGGQEATIEARLVDPYDVGVSGQELVFELTGPEGTRSIAGATDSNGVASVTFTVTEPPGSYELTVSFAEVTQELTGSTASTAFTVQ